MNRMLSIVSGVALAVAGGGAQADSFATASLTNLSLSVVDLTPNDGVAPGFTSDYAAYAQMTGPSGYGYDSNFGDASVVQDANNYAKVVNPGNVITGVTETAAVRVPSNGPSAGYTSNAEIFGGFTLAAHSELVLAGDTALTAGDDEGVHSTQAGSQTDFAIYVPFTDSPPGAIDILSVSAIGTNAGHLQVVFDNPGDTEVTGNFYAQILVAAVPFVAPSPVPEPAAVAMLLAGLGLAGQAARRARR